MNIKCVQCGEPYPDQGAPHKCPLCGGLFDYADPLTYYFPFPKVTGIWRFASSFGLEADSSFGDYAVSLGEGDTPLIPANAFGRIVHFKCEYASPSGSFKDRGMAMLVAFLKSRGVTEAVEDSSGNAGASFAAYAARAGMKARVFAPESASGPKRRQIELYGAELVPVPGPRSAATDAVLKAVDEGAVYASHAYLPFNIPGYATAAYEIWEQLGCEVGAVIVPAGQGGLLLGMARGFQALVNAGMLKKMPVMIGIQAAACAPLVALAETGSAEMTESATLAEGVRVANPLRKAEVVEAAINSGGRFVSVNEADILSGRDALARLGFYVEPTSALVWRALFETLSDLPDPVVAVLTGSGLKFAE